MKIGLRVSVSGFKLYGLGGLEGGLGGGYRIG